MNLRFSERILILNLGFMVKNMFEREVVFVFCFKVYYVICIGKCRES